MVALGRWFTHSFLLTLKFLSGYVHRSTLPQRGSREWLVPFIGVLAKILRYGRFSSPLRNSKDLTLYHSSKYTPSVSPSGCQLPQGGSREWPVPFIGVLAEIPGCGRFSSPLRKAGAIHRPGGGNQSSSSFSTAINASEGTETVPKVRIRFLPSFCFSSSFFFRVMSPP